MEIKIRRRRGQIAETTVKKEVEEEEQPLSPAARLFHAPEFNCYIISVVGLKNKIEPDMIIEGIKQTLMRHPRFSSKLDHVIIPKIQTQHIENANADVFLESYVSDLTTIPLDTSKPLWEVHLLDLKTSDAENVAVLRIHHSLGDGMSMMSLVLACTRKTSNPNELPSLPYQNRPSSGSSSLKTSSRCYSRFFWLVMVLWSAALLVLNTVCDALEFIATALFLKDTETPIKGDFKLSKGKRMCMVHRTVSLDDIKLIKNAMKMTVNDVVLGVSQAGLSQSLKRRYGEQEQSKRNSSNIPKGIRLRAALLDLADMMAKGSKCRWGNWIGYIIFPFSIALCDDPLEHLRRAKSTIDRKKNSLEAVLTFVVGKILLNTLGVQALTMHFQSYMNKLTISLTVDPTVISDPHKLCDDWEESLRSIKAAVQERTSTQ
ncbi:unnamed protein product [Arabidopsis thaliana]|uniref:(thale cress) hypothetical protein n=1 Tax=Arabidopsis thaliana TaxID=3702 RepID=A0A7G2ERE4_ARATH|nr:unnamed protein product [Arabidopsis thaliana]